MRPIRDILSELVDRRLWPIAVVLIAALVAIPLVLAKSSGPSGSGDASVTPAAVKAAAAAAAAQTASDQPLVTVAGTAPSSARLRGHAKNPFRQQHVPKAVKAKEGGSAPVHDGGASGGSAAPGSGTTPSGHRPATPKKTYVHAAIDVRFGKAVGRLHSHTDVPRLTPLPRAANPIVIFLGMRADHATAVFLVSTDVHVQGEGKCIPSPRTCQSIELKEGQSAFLDVTGADGRVTQYELDLEHVRVEQTTSKAAAQAAYARVSRVGRRLLHVRATTTAQATGTPFRMPFRYAPTRGVLHIAPYLSVLARHRRAAGAVAGTAAP